MVNIHFKRELNVVRLFLIQNVLSFIIKSAHIATQLQLASVPWEVSGLYFMEISWISQSKILNGGGGEGEVSALNKFSLQCASSLNPNGVLKYRELLISRVITGVAVGDAELFPLANQHTHVGKTESWQLITFRRSRNYEWVIDKLYLYMRWLWPHIQHQVHLMSPSNFAIFRPLIANMLASQADCKQWRNQTFSVGGRGTASVAYLGLKFWGVFVSQIFLWLAYR